MKRLIRSLFFLGLYTHSTMQGSLLKYGAGIASLGLATTLGITTALTWSTLPWTDQAHEFLSEQCREPLNQEFFASYTPEKEISYKREQENYAFYNLTPAQHTEISQILEKKNLPREYVNIVKACNLKNDHNSMGKYFRELQTVGIDRSLLQGDKSNSVEDDAGRRSLLTFVLLHELQHHKYDVGHQLCSDNLAIITPAITLPLWAVIGTYIAKTGINAPGKIAVGIGLALTARAALPAIAPYCTDTLKEFINIGSRNEEWRADKKALEIINCRNCIKKAVAYRTSHFSEPASLAYGLYFKYIKGYFAQDIDSSALTHMPEQCEMCRSTHSSE